MSPSRKFVRLGKILQEWGIKGQVRFLSFNGESEIYPKLQCLYDEGAEHSCLEIEAVKRHGRYWLLKFKGYETPERAKELRGKTLGLDRSDLPKPRKGEIYVNDLEGLEVRAANGNIVGEIVGFLRVGDHEVMRIQRESQDEALVPYQDEFVEKTDLEAGVITLKDYAQALL